MKIIKQYDKYKPSAIAWMSDIPQHWEAEKLKHVFTINKNISGELGHKVLSITQTGIKIKDTESGGGQLSMDYSKYQIVNIGDFAMNHMDLLTGYVDISKFEGVTSPDYRVFKLKKNSSDKKYLLFLLQLGYKLKLFYSLGQGVSQFGRWRLPAESFNHFKFPIPPLSEQTAIANFLDYKTNKIDRFIRKKKQLIKLLNEQKAGIINQAVIKGLDTNAKMKPSGIEWLGDIPEHWEVRKAKSLGKAIIGLTYSPLDLTDEGYGTLVLRSSNVQDGKITYDDCVYVKTPIPDKKRTKIGDILICSRNGSIRLIGKNAVIDEKSSGESFGAFMTIFRSENFHFLHYFFNSASFKAQSGLFTTSTINQLTTGILNNILVAFPKDFEEQRAIVSHIETETSKLNKAITTIEKEITLVQEYKTALIAEAVTGKIDVRDYVIPILEEEETYEDIEEELDMVAEDSEELEIE